MRITEVQKGRVGAMNLEIRTPLVFFYASRVDLPPNASTGVSLNLVAPLRRAMRLSPETGSRGGVVFESDKTETNDA